MKSTTRLLLVLCVPALAVMVAGCEITHYGCEEPGHWPWDCEGSDCLGGCSADDDCDDAPACALDWDCAHLGPGMVCDEAGECVADDGPCPDGACGCVEDSECGEGLLCMGSLCTDPADLCVFDFECGADSLCIDSACHMTCTCDCPAGQSCVDGICLDARGLDECVYDEDCGAGSACVDAACHPTCIDDDGCGQGETCASGVCLASTAPERECAVDGDCETDMICGRGACRLPCVADVNCRQGATICGDEGFCLYQSELDAQCIRAEDCAVFASCRDGRCVGDPPAEG